MVIHKRPHIIMTLDHSKTRLDGNEAIHLKEKYFWSLSKPNETIKCEGNIFRHIKTKWFDIPCVLYQKASGRCIPPKPDKKSRKRKQYDHGIGINSRDRRRTPKE